MNEGNRGLDLERELTCSICTEVLFAPRTLLDCLHTFCGPCLKEWFSWQLSSSCEAPDAPPTSVNPYTCPSCRAPVRDTKHNSTVTTLLEMFLAANPEKCRTIEEQKELRKKCSFGDNLFPKRSQQRERSQEERQIEEADRRLVNEVREMSLREVGLESSDARRERHQREDHSSHVSGRSRDRNAGHNDESHEQRSRERRRQREEHRQARGRESIRPPSEIRRRRRPSHEGRAHSNRRLRSDPAESKSSLRSLISTPNLDSREMEEEILRQIKEEGLLDGIDLEHIDANQESQISERITEAFRRWQKEQIKAEQTNRLISISSSNSPEIPGEDSFQPLIRSSINQTRTSNATSQSSQQSRPPQSISAIQAAQLEENPGNQGRQRIQQIGINNRSYTDLVPSTRSSLRPATRSVSDPSDRPKPLRATSTWPAVSESSRSSLDLPTPPVTDITARELRMKLPRVRSNSSLRGRSTSRSNDTPLGETINLEISNVPAPLLTTNLSTCTSVESNLVPAPLFPKRKVLDRANIVNSGSRPSSVSPQNRSPLFTEPLVNCARCARTHIEYEWHYNCSKCSGGHYNICLSCYRTGHGCLHWLGNGPMAWKSWENLKRSGRAKKGKPHTLTPSRYLPPKVAPGGADGRRTLTIEDPQNRLQSGTFCANCFAWTNECYWRCDTCNEGDWGFCNNCVNQGRSCTHPIMPLTYKPPENKPLLTSSAPEQRRPTTASVLTGPGIMEMGSFKPLTFSTRCEICRYPIQPSQTRFHCFECSSSFPETSPGDYDVCSTCYPKLIWSRRISIENGPCGWRRCLKGHRMVVVGFDDKHGGQRRLLVKDLVGGRCLSQKPYTAADFADQGLQIWSWGDGTHVCGDGSHVKLVTTDSRKEAPSSAHTLGLDAAFPPNGGVGMRAVANWGWYPAEDANDELLFPKGAEIREVKDVNGDWFHGSYMGRKGLFPSNYVRILDRS